MRILFTIIISAFLYSLTTTLIAYSDLTSGDFFYWFVLTFGFICIPLFFSVCIFHLTLTIYEWTNKRPLLLFKILILWTIYNLILLSVNLPDFFRHQKNPDYVHYKSFTDYYMTNMLEGLITATCFAIAIPFLDKFIKNEIDKFDKKHELKQT